MKKVMYTIISIVVVLTACIIAYKTSSVEAKVKRAVVESIKSKMYEPRSLQIESYKIVKEATYEEIYNLEVEYNNVKIHQEEFDKWDSISKTTQTYKKLTQLITKEALDALIKEKENLKVINTKRDSLKHARKLQETAVKVYKIEYKKKNINGERVSKIEYVIVDNRGRVKSKGEDLNLLGSEVFLSNKDRYAFDYVKESIAVECEKTAKNKQPT